MISFPKLENFSVDSTESRENKDNPVAEFYPKWDLTLHVRENSKVIYSKICDQLKTISDLPLSCHTFYSEVFLL